MSKELERARERFAAGHYRRAVAALWYVQRNARQDIGEARALLEMASAIRERRTGRLRKECDQLASSAAAMIQQLESASADKNSVPAKESPVSAGAASARGQRAPDAPPGRGSSMLSAPSARG